MYPKHKHHPAATGPAATVQKFACGNTEEESAQQARVARIVRFGMKLHRTPPVNDATMQRIAAGIVKHAKANCVEPELAAALIGRESGFNPRAVSHSGAKGLGQLIDSTARKLNVSDPFDIEDNLRGCISYFRQLMDIWNGYPDQVERALASYNAGPGAVKRSGPGVSRQFVVDILKYRDRILSM